ncbi:alanine racemase domain-containing protein [Streptomyces albus]|uniref:Alanine racemase domain-containing protein n=1 Tax=Streptomyces albus (strain ATCC 21838 / DSM 41398 / FERM P-419 / JCM 4703 / NBRC 107858) TaxID=1081613 RepID=A0A0B5EWF1_STRA4|nr:alanine racemase domain-containing protein [Streptomyces albus]AOU76726.1 alanine racemase domain-containing protein [Streptomyces albus]AYN32506.1 alanine racemase [Streptomyces albus]
MADLSAPRRRRTSFGELTTATAGLPAPCAALDLAALRTNAADLLRRAAGKPIRIASKSVRSRAVLHGALALDGMAGVLAYTLPEALWLAGEIEDVLVGYPTADEQALAALAADEQLAARVTLMIDSADQLEFTAAALGSPGGPPIRVCLELDASLRLAAGRLHVGSRRSPAHSPEAVARLARAVTRHPRFTLVGLMAYEGQIAGIGDNQPGSPVTRLGVRAMQRTSAAELHERRAAAVAAVRAVAPLEFVNGGGTGSLELTSAEEAVTEVAAGSGLFAPALFDHYTRFHPLPAAHFALPVVRRPSPRHATVLGGGWIASGPPGRDRLPVPVWPRGLRLLATEGAGEVQTPLGGPGAAGLRIGDRVWFRHAKAGELCEHVDELHLVDEGRLTGSAPTYRGEGKTFL